ncbi:hypothetical protein CR513_01962, partial [Mucuna pruriens]
MDDNVYNHIASEIHVKTLWEKIESLYASNLRKALHCQMSKMGIKFENEILGLLLLNSLSKSWDTFKVFITNLVPNGVVSL